MPPQLLAYWRKRLGAYGGHNEPAGRGHPKAGGHNPPAGRMGFFTWKPATGGRVLGVFKLPTLGHGVGGLVGETAIPMACQALVKLVKWQPIQAGTYGYDMIEALAQLAGACGVEKPMPGVAEGLATVGVSRLGAHFLNKWTKGWVGFSAGDESVGLQVKLGAILKGDGKPGQVPAGRHTRGALEDRRGETMPWRGSPSVREVGRSV